MAAPDRPLACLTCLDEKRQLSSFSGNKIRGDHSVFSSILSFLDLEYSDPINKMDFSRYFLCQPCIKRILTYSSFRKESIINARSFGFYESEVKPTTPKSKRTTVIDQITSWVEKLKLHVSKSTTPSKLSVAEQIEVSVRNKRQLSTPIGNDSKKQRVVNEESDIKIQTGEKKSRKSLNFQPDHNYSKHSLKASMEKEEKVKQSLDDLCNADLHLEFSSYTTKIKSFITTAASGKSVLNETSVTYLTNPDLFLNAASELKDGCPFLFHVLYHALGDKSKSSKIATIATIYGMLLHSHNPKASAVQRIFTSAAIRYHADNKLLGVLNKIHITLSDNSKAKLLDSFAGYSEECLLQTIASGADGKLNGDNLDLQVNTNDVRMNNKNKDYHFFATNWVVDRVNLQSMEDQAPIGNIDNVSLSNFLPNTPETDQFKEYLKILLGKKLCENIQGFQWMGKVLPHHIMHDLQDEMSKKSKIFMLPILLKNEACYSDCLHILEHYVGDINRWYSKAGRGSELKTLRVPVGGDQLTRVRLDGAKMLRLGAHTDLERFDQLYPFIIELFHTMQDFLDKMCKTFLKLKTSTDKGTLAHLKAVIHRSNVNGQVKVRFKAHEQFFDDVGTAYLLTLVMDLFGMDSLESDPVHDVIPHNIKNIHTEKKNHVLDAVMELIIAATFIKPLQHDIDLGQSLQSDNTDGLLNYTTNYLNWYYVLIVLRDAIAEGNIVMTNISLKFMIPLFYSHSTLSKYMTECIDYILKTEVTLTPKQSLKVRAGSFVNTMGKQGHNKAADMEKENEVKLLKELIRGLGANKTEKSIVRISKVTPIIQSISTNLSSMIGKEEIHTTHKKRSSEEDILEILKDLKNINPWQYTPGRNLTAFKHMSKSPYHFDHCDFENCVLQTVNRLKKGIPEQSEDTQ